MQAIGLTCSPIDFCNALRQEKERFTVDELGKPKLVVFTSFEAFKHARPQKTNKKVVIFETLERLLMIQNLFIVKQKTISAIVRSVIEYDRVQEPVHIKNIDYVKDIIEKNKDDNTSFFHIYNTSLYQISFTPVRDQIRNLYLAYLNGTIKRADLERGIKPLYPKRGKSLKAVNTLMELLDSELFARMQVALKQARGKSNKEVEAIATKQGVAAYDLRYLLATMK